jgi:hypothetical protein
MLDQRLASNQGKRFAWIPGGGIAGGNNADDFHAADLATEGQDAQTRFKMLTKK